MPSDERKTQQRRSTGTRKTESVPLNFSDSNRQDADDLDGRPYVAEEDLLAEDDPLASNPPRPTTSSIRLGGSTGFQRRTGGQSGQNSPLRRTGQQFAPFPGSMQARSGRNTTFQRPFLPIAKSGGNVHWLLYVGVGMVAALALWVAGSSVLAFATAKYNDLTYGNPRTFQIDAVVGHGGDSAQHPSHFVALNLKGQVIVIELMAGNPAKSISYTGPYLFDGDSVPITLEFKDVNHDGKPDMLIHIQDKIIVFLNDGTKFVPSKG